MNPDDLYVIRVPDHCSEYPGIYNDVIFTEKECAKAIFTKLITTDERAGYYKSSRTEIMTLSEYIKELQDIIDSCPYQE